MLTRRRLLASSVGAACCLALPAGAQRQRTADAIEQFGTAWTFRGEHEAGRYVNGDWWVVGPVEIVEISPRSLRGERVKNGAMINPKGGPVRQGYDSATYGSRAEGRYDDALNAALDVGADNPLTLDPGSSLISSISHDEPGARPQLRSAAILTVLDAPPPEGSFRPPYCGSDKASYWNVAQVDPSRLATLEATRGAPAVRDMEDQFERPWIDHVSGWMGRDIHPSENMPDYGRDIARRIGDAALLLNTDLPLARKERLLVSFLQLGVDLYGVARDGGSWAADGGHASGRKLPILMAGLLLGDPAMLAVETTSEARFGEDDQTFYVEETAPGVMNEGAGSYRMTDRGLPEWGIRHAYQAERDDPSWDARYRTCCTASAWTGAVLAAHAMGLRDLWGHEALFDYQDRYMAAEHRERWQRSNSSWAAAMWDRHRAEFPPVWGD